MSTPPPTPTDEAQRELERRALRNVRGLIDRIEEGDEVDARSQRRLLAGLVGGALAVALVIAAVLIFGKDARTTITVQPKSPPATRAAQ